MPQTANKVLNKQLHAASLESERNDGDLDAEFVAQPPPPHPPPTHHFTCEQNKTVADEQSHRGHRRRHDTQSGAALCGPPMWPALETLIFGRGRGATAGLNQTG